MNTETQSRICSLSIQERVVWCLCLASALGLAAPASSAVFTVNVSTDLTDAVPGDGVCEHRPFGMCSLRAAVQEANALVGTDEIILPAGVYTLTIPPTPPGNSDADGDLEISDDLQVTGAATGVTVIDGNDLDRIFEVNLGVHASISGVTIRNGNAGGGGGIWNAGDLELVDCVITENTTDNSGGAGVKSSSGATLVVENCLISLNNATDNHGGGIENQGIATISFSVIDGNTANHSGGGLFNDDLAEMTVEHSTISGNTANTDFEWWGGGGIMNLGALSVDSSTISGNSAATSDGGGVNSLGGHPVLVNTTLNGNTAASEGGGFYGGAGHLSATFLNCTVADNTATAGGGVFHNGWVFFDATIVAYNAGGNCLATTDCASFCHNLDSEDSCGFSWPGDLINTDPLLGPLAANGGPTQTHALASDSPAIDGGDPANGCWDLSASPLDVDQRGVFRPIDGDSNGIAVCDIGAFEYEGAFFADGFESGDTGGWSSTVP